MPGAGMHCLNTIQPIFGCDAHRTLPPPAPVLPFAPHVVVWGEGWSESFGLPLSKATSKAARGAGANAACKAGGPVSCGWGYAVGRTHDAGPWAVHIWPNALLPIILFGAGNKSEFASGTVMLPTGKMAIAVAYVVNMQLDCWDFPFPPLPTSACVAAANTVYAGFTFGDFMGGLAAMAFDMAVSWLIALACAGAGAGVSKLLGKVPASIFAGPAASSIFNETAPGFFKRFGQLAADMFTKDIFVAGVKTWLKGKDGPAGAVVGIAIALVIGTPLGYSQPHAVASDAEGSVNDKINDGVAGLFN